MSGYFDKKIEHQKQNPHPFLGYIRKCLLSDETDEVKNNKNLVMEAIKYCAYDLQFASEELKNDKEVVSLALKEDETTFKFVSEKLRADKEICLLASSKFTPKSSTPYSPYEDMPKEMQLDKDIIYTIIKTQPYNYTLAKLLYPECEYLEDRELILLATRNGSLEIFSSKWRGDKEIVKLCLMNNGSAIKDASEELQNDEELALLALETSSSCYDVLVDKFKYNDDFILKAVEKSPFIYYEIVNYLQAVESKYKIGTKVSLRAVELDPSLIESVPQEDLEYVKKTLNIQ